MPPPTKSLFRVCALATTVVSACACAPPTTPRDREAVVEVPTIAATTPVAASARPTSVREPREPDVDSCVTAVRDGKLDGPRALVDPGDDDRYHKALAAERAGRLDDARKGYLELIRSSPTSPRIPLAYFAFGEIFRGELAGDPSKLALAEQSYREVLKVPPDENPAWVLASTRLAEISIASDAAGGGPPSGRERALADAMRAIDATKSASEPCQLVFADAARAHLVDGYADVGRPERAWSFLARASDDRRENQGLDALLARLVGRYAERDREAEALTLIDDVAGRTAVGSFCARSGEALLGLDTRAAVRVRARLADRCGGKR